MTSAAPEPGWLPDPWDARRERYWDGAEWAPQWRVRGSQPQQLPPQARSGSPLGRSDQSRTLLIIGVIVAVAITMWVVVWVVKPGESKWQHTCESLASKDGYVEGSSSYRQAVDACVIYADKFGHP